GFAVPTAEVRSSRLPPGHRATRVENKPRLLNQSSESAGERGVCQWRLNLHQRHQSLKTGSLSSTRPQVNLYVLAAGSRHYTDDCVDLINPQLAFTTSGASNDSFECDYFFDIRQRAVAFKAVNPGYHIFCGITIDLPERKHTADLSYILLLQFNELIRSM